MNGTAETTNRPLAGKRVLVGRARHQATVLSDALRELGAEVIEIPFIEIRPPASFKPLDHAIQRLLDYDWLILTSVNGVQAFFRRLARHRKSEADLLHLDIAAIGPATRKAIEHFGLPVDVMPAEYVAESVVASLKGLVRDKNVLLVRAKVARDVIPNQLSDAGAHVTVVEAYETVVPESSRIALRELLHDPARKPHMIIFTSSSSVKNFVDLLGVGESAAALLDGVQLASIGPVTSGTLREAGLRADIEARQFTIPALIEAIVAAQ